MTDTPLPPRREPLPYAAPGTPGTPPARPLRRFLLIIVGTVVGFVVFFVALVAIFDTEISLSARALGGATLAVGAAWLGYLIYNGRRQKRLAAPRAGADAPMTWRQWAGGAIVTATICATIVGARVGIDRWERRNAPPPPPPSNVQELLKTEAGRRIAVEMAKQAFEKASPMGEKRSIRTIQSDDDSDSTPGATTTPATRP